MLSPSESMKLSDLNYIIYRILTPKNYSTLNWTTVEANKNEITFLRGDNAEMIFSG